MPRGRPPGAGSGSGSGSGSGLRRTTALLTLFLVLPWISTAAQQQRPSPLDAYVEPIPPKARQPNPNNASKRNTYTPLISQNERAVATKASAPAHPAVRAPLARNAYPPGGLTPNQRSLEDWVVEDFVLLATVDGRIHARDRYSGAEIWTLNVEQPMLETTYNLTVSQNNDPQNLPFLWIVEPKEDGALYILKMGSPPEISNLGMTVKQLAEDLAPLKTDDPPVVYLVDKKNVMLTVDARTGKITKSFSTNGSMVFDDRESCARRKGSEYFGAPEPECKGLFNLGRTEYTISIQNEKSGENSCIIKYSEWIPNNQDLDLRRQYRETMDNNYIYTRYDGQAIAQDHKRPRPAKSPVFKQTFSSPVVRVFDVAKPRGIEDPDANLVLLPQPPSPRLVQDRSEYVWLNTTETGTWYALSEANYPDVTSNAPLASCCREERSHNELVNLDEHPLPDRQSLVGVHTLVSHSGNTRPTVPGIGPPSQIPGPFPPVAELPDRPYYDHQDEQAVGKPEGQPVESPSESPKEQLDEPQDERRDTHETRGRSRSTTIAIMVLLVAIGAGAAYLGGTAHSGPLKNTLNNLLSRFAKIRTSEPLKVALHTTPPTQPRPDVTPDPILVVDGSTETPAELPVEELEKKAVHFDLPDDEEDDLAPLSRTTTAEQASPLSEDNQTDGLELISADPSQSGQNGTAATPSTPTKKKKAHRGKRGGNKKLKKLSSEDEVDRIVNAAKGLDQEPTIHPDELAVKGDDIQDVSNIKKIGKLTIDFDKVLGNGSGGTFVFKGTWHDLDVAIKRMLPQYFEIAKQEVTLLRKNTHHDNVIRYFDDEQDENFLYIAVELCQASLFDLYRDGRPGDEVTEDQQRLVNEINTDVPSALYQLADGLNHLHSLRIVHRDIKPQNILIAYPQRGKKKDPRLVISDFGLCKTLPDNVSTLIGTTGNAGTVGWKAPELILQPRDIMDRNSSTGHSRDSSSSSDPVAEGVKRAVDIFSLGCVFFYVLTNGLHPFDDEEGWMQMRELNIKKNKANYEQLSLGDDSEEPRHLIEWMLSNRPKDRPTALEVMNHPFFWTAEKRLNFLCDCSDHWEREVRDPPSTHLSILETYSPKVIGDKKPDFLAKLNRSFVASLGKQRKYTGDRMLDLLRALRNKKNHYEDMDESVKAMVGPLPHGYLTYWTLKFPRLLISCYECVAECGLQGEPRFRPYFEGQVGR